MQELNTEYKEIWTIGHSTHPIEYFIRMLTNFKIEVIADVRRYPGSRRYPQFNSDALEQSLKLHDIEYVPMPDLGGRRQPAKDSVNSAWRNDAFRGYADYMQTSAYSEAFKKMEAIALLKHTAYMCSEAPWWRCHRSLISDHLKSEGWQVMHIMSATKTEEHPYTKPANVINGKLTYAGNDLPFN
jgi:uncharacterized protein (DUF488 family)